MKRDKSERSQTPDEIKKAMLSFLAKHKGEIPVTVTVLLKPYQWWDLIDNQATRGLSFDEQLTEIIRSADGLGLSELEEMVARKGGEK